MFTDEDQRRAYWENLEDEKQLTEDQDAELTNDQKEFIFTEY